jgi:hypothetical protein
MKRASLLLLVLLAGCVRPHVAPPPAAPAPWVETRLYFATGSADHPERGLSDAQWRDFLDHEVTPRFPDGLSVADIYGQWKGKNQTAPGRERSKMLIIDYPDTPENSAKIEAIRTAYKLQFHQQSVMRVTQPANVSF